MEINLNTLEINQRFIYDEDIEFAKDIYHNNEIKDLKNVHLKGDIYYNSAEILEINLDLTGEMLLSDSVNLEDVLYPFNININEEYSLNDEYFKEYYENDQNILDIMSILWENIKLEVPMHLTTTKDATINGEGWSLGIRDNTDKIDPRLEKLTQVLGKGKE